MLENKACPLMRFKPCLLQKCAWYYANECAVASMGWIDHTLQKANGLAVEREENETCI